MAKIPLTNTVVARYYGIISRPHYHIVMWDSNRVTNTVVARYYGIISRPHWDIVMWNSNRNNNKEKKNVRLNADKCIIIK